MIRLTPENKTIQQTAKNFSYLPQLNLLNLLDAPNFAFQCTGDDLRAWLDWARTVIPTGDCPAGYAELTYLMTLVTNIDRLSLSLGTYQHQTLIQSQLSLEQLRQLWEIRWQKAVPLQYLLGLAHWRDLTLEVTPAVLIPRPETEELIDLVMHLINNHCVPATGHWVDLGTGSGAIALGLAQELPLAQIHGVDTSLAALEIAHNNICRYNHQERIILYPGSWLEPLQHLRGQIEAIVTNPPYIPSATIEQLQPEVKEHEPRLALDGGKDGLQAIKALAIAAPDYLKPGGWLLMELMAGQGDAVLSLLATLELYSSSAIIPDINQTPRFLMAQVKSEWEHPNLSLGINTQRECAIKICTSKA